MIFGLTIQKVGKRFDFRCPECTLITGRIGLIREEGPPIRLYCQIHPENFGTWDTPEDMEAERLALAQRIGLR
jgi:hypothetical protein